MGRQHPLGPFEQAYGRNWFSEQTRAFPKTWDLPRWLKRWVIMPITHSVVRDYTH